MLISNPLVVKISFPTYIVYCLKSFDIIELFLKTRSTEAQPIASIYKILGGKSVKNVQIDPQTTKICLTDLNIPLSVCDKRSE